MRKTQSIPLTRMMRMAARQTNVLAKSFNGSLDLFSSFRCMMIKMLLSCVVFDTANLQLLSTADGIAEMCRQLFMKYDSLSLCDMDTNNHSLAAMKIIKTKEGFGTTLNQWVFIQSRYITYHLKKQ